MIPFLKSLKEASVSVPAEKITRTPDEGAEYDGLTAAAEDFANAIKSEDYHAAGMALRAAFDVLQSDSHQEEGI